MKRFRAINLIAFCALVVLLADDSSASLIKYFPTLLRNLKHLKTLRHGIVPGTLWCGPGHIAGNYSELGENSKLDICCRAHDFCNDYINPRGTRYGLHNRDKLCRSSSCDCDLKFYNCVKKAPGVIAFYVGKIYFKRCKQCFNVYYDIEMCYEKGLTVSEKNEGQGRNGSRVFCAQFDRNPKWGRPHDVTMSKSTDAPPNWFDSEAEGNTPLSYPMDDDDDDEYEDEDDDTIPDIDWRMLNTY